MKLAGALNRNDASKSGAHVPFWQVSSFPALAPPEIAGRPVFTGVFTSAAKSDVLSPLNRVEGVPAAVEVPDPDPQPGRPAGPVDLVRCGVDRWPCRRRAVEQGLCGADGAAPQWPHPDRAGVEVGPVDLARRGVGRDADRVVLAAKQGLGGARAVQVPGPNLVGELVRPVDLVVRGVDRYSARSASARVCEQGRGIPIPSRLPTRISLVLKLAQ